MAASILVTKLFVPHSRAEFVHRLGLIERLNDGLDRKLTLLSAPAGFGKTTLVSHWLEHLQVNNEIAGQPIKVAWLSLDGDDNDPVRFLTYFIAALNQSKDIETDIGQGALNLLQSPQPPPPNTVLISLINELAAIPEKIVFVLDDYHLIEEKLIHQALVFLLKNLPSQLHVVIATRQDPSLSLGRLRARCQLTELRAVDLRFTSSEAADFLNQVMGLNLSSGDIAELETRTEGWIAGLQLAAISMQGRKDYQEFIKSFTGGHRLVLDFLIEEVLGQQPESVQNFLLQTAILDRMTGSLCDALTGQDNGQETLEMLDHANLFIVHLDEERRWYRYHHLFADLLQYRFRQIHPDDLSGLHIKASEWFRSQGFNQEAIRYSLAGRDFQNAAELIKDIEIDIILQGASSKVVGWINALPDQLVKERPYLSILHAWALRLMGQLENAEARLIDAEKALKSMECQDDENEDTFLGLIHFNRVYLSFMIGDHDQTIYHALQALDKLPVTETIIRAQTNLYLGLAYRYNGQLQTAMDIFNEVLPTAQSMAGGNIINILCYLHLGYLHLEMAQLHRAKEIFEGALKSTERHLGHSELPYTGSIYVNIGHILRQWNQLEDAYHFTEKGLSLCRDWNVADALALSCLEIAYLHQAIGNDKQARSFIQEAIQIFNNISQWGNKIGAANQVKFDLMYGDIESVDRWIQTNDLDINSDFEFYREIEYLVLVRALIAQKRFDEAHTLAERIYEIAQETGKRQTELEVLILLAVVFSGQGKTEQALVLLERALFIGQPERYIRIFVDEGPPMASLLYEALKRNIAPEYVQRLLAAFPVTEQDEDTSTKPQVDQSGLIEPLSDREIDVIQLIAKGLTNQEISNKLFLSMHTVKTHTRNIYSKLGAHHRAEAVAKARAFGIL